MVQPVPWLLQHPQRFPLLMSPAEKRRMPSNNLVPNLLCRETGPTIVNFNLVTNNEGPTLVSTGVSSSEASFRFQAKQTPSQQSYCWIPGQCQHRKNSPFYSLGSSSVSKILRSGFFPHGEHQSRPSKAAHCRTAAVKPLYLLGTSLLVVCLYLSIYRSIYLSYLSIYLI